MRIPLALLTAVFLATALLPVAGGSHVVRAPAGVPTGVDAWDPLMPVFAAIPSVQRGLCGTGTPWCLENLTTVDSTAESPVGVSIVAVRGTPEICNPLAGQQAHCYHVHAGCYESGRGQWNCWHGLIWCDLFVNKAGNGDVHTTDDCTHA